MTGFINHKIALSSVGFSSRLVSSSLLAALLSFSVVSNLALAAVPATKAKAKPQATKPAVPTAGKVYSGSANKNVQALPIQKKIDLTRDIPLEISAYDKNNLFPQKPASAEEVIALMDQNRNLLVHMELIRRSYHSLVESEKAVFLEKLFQRYRTINEDSTLFFDHGYAQLVFLNNKTGLFFLRKANDSIRNQFSSLAYGMAQVEADINLEDEPADKMTARKIDATFMLKDAVRRDAVAHKPGFWPSYVKVLEQMKSLKAYHDLLSTDLSMYYVSYGNITVPELSPEERYAASRIKADKAASSSDTASAASTSTSSCQAVGQFKADPVDTLYNERYLNMKATGEPMKLQFFKTPSQPDQYKVALWDKQSNLLANFTSPVAPHIVEDIDGDNQYEFVVRQYLYEPLEPVQVYRFKDCGFVLDTDVENLFK